MSLNITVRTGGDFYVDDERYVVQEVVPMRYFTLFHDDIEEVIRLNQFTEVEPDVFIAMGAYTHSGRIPTAMVRVNAPKDRIILRGKLYRQDRQRAIQAQQAA